MKIFRVVVFSTFITSIHLYAGEEKKAPKKLHEYAEKVQTEDLDPEDLEILELKNRMGIHHPSLQRKIGKIKKKQQKRKYYEKLYSKRLAWEAEADSLEKDLGLKLINYYEKNLHALQDLEYVIQKSIEHYGNLVFQLYSSLRKEFEKEDNYFHDDIYEIESKITAIMQAKVLDPNLESSQTHPDFAVFNRTYKKDIDNLLGKIRLLKIKHQHKIGIQKRNELAREVLNGFGSFAFICGAGLALLTSPIWGPPVFVYSQVYKVAKKNEDIYNANIKGFLDSLVDSHEDQIKRDLARKIFNRYYKFRARDWNWNQFVETLGLEAHTQLTKENKNPLTQENNNRKLVELLNSVEYNKSDYIKRYNHEFYHIFVGFLKTIFIENFKDSEENQWEKELLKLAELSAIAKQQTKKISLFRPWKSFNDRRQNRRHNMNRIEAIIVKHATEFQDYEERFAQDLLDNLNNSKIHQEVLNWDQDDDIIFEDAKKIVLMGLMEEEKEADIDRYLDMEKRATDTISLKQAFQKRSPQLIGSDKTSKLYEFQKDLANELAKVNSVSKKKELTKLANRMLLQNNGSYQEFLKIYGKERKRVKIEQLEFDFLEFLRTASEDLSFAGEEDGVQVVPNSAIEAREETKSRFSEAYIEFPEDPFRTGKAYNNTYCAVCQENIELDFIPKSRICHCDIGQDTLVQVPVRRGEHLLSVCGHPIHLDCLSNIKESNFACPICRKQIPYHEGDRSAWEDRYGFSYQEFIEKYEVEEAF